MRMILRDILCWIGWHSWEYHHSYTSEEVDYSCYRCKHCDAYEEVETFDEALW